MTNYFIFAVSICFISWIFAIAIKVVFISDDHIRKFSNLNFVRSKRFNKILLVGLVKWMTINTFFKFFNPALKMGKRDTDLVRLRHEMTIAEISHLVAFVFVLFFVIYMSLEKSILYGFIVLFINHLMNLCPSLLQQENKRRLDKIIFRKEKNRI